MMAKEGGELGCVRVPTVPRDTLRDNLSYSVPL